MSATNQAEQTALTLPERASVALKAADYELKIKEKVAASADIVTVKNAAGREQAHRIGMDLLKLRTGITAAGEVARQDATAFSKAVIARERELVALISPEEKRVIALRYEWDEKIAAEKAAKIDAERARVEAVQKDIDNFRRIPQLLIGKSVADLAFALKDMRAMLVTEERFEEFTGDAENVVADVTAAIESMHAKAVEAEAAALAAEEARKAEADRLEAERAELAKLRAEQIERERIAKIESDRIAAEQAAEAGRLADMKSAQEAEQRRIAEQAAANLRQEREAQEEAMRVQREAQAEEQRKAAEEIRLAREKLEAAQAAHNAAMLAQQEAAQREADHAEGLEMNAALDTVQPRLAEIEVPTFSADLARCNAMVATARADAEAQSLSAYRDAGLDCPELTDEEIIAFGAEVGLGLAELVTRLEAFTVYARAELLV